MVGIAFLGASDAETSKEVKKAIENSAGAFQYPFLSDCEPVLTQGNEVYAFVPVDDECVITIYNSKMNQECEYIDDRENPLYQGKKGETVILRCNFSDLYSNVLVSEKNNDKEIEFRPSLSLRDGAVLLEEGCIDISVYADSIYDRRAEAEELLCSKDEVIDGMAKGMELVCFDEEEMIDGESCIVFYLGTDHEENFVKEHTYAVSQNQVYWYDPIGDEWNILGEG